MKIREYFELVFLPYMDSDGYYQIDNLPKFMITSESKQYKIHPIDDFYYILDKNETILNYKKIIHNNYNKHFIMLIGNSERYVRNVKINRFLDV